MTFPLPLAARTYPGGAQFPLRGQQAHKYEKGLNRLTAGRLYAIAQALGVEVGYFFEGVQTAARFEPSPEQRMLIDLARDYLNVPAPEHRAAIAALARALAEENVKTGGA